MIKEVVAKTFTPVYDEIEDRIRLVINYQDIQNRIDFMITRSFIINLIPSVDDFTLKHYASDYTDIDNMKVSINTNNNENKAVNRTDGVNLELLRTEEELLLEINLSYDASTKNTLLTFTSKNKKANCALDSKTIKQVFDTIKSAIPNFKWGIASNF